MFFENCTFGEFGTTKFRESVNCFGHNYKDSKIKKKRVFYKNTAMGKLYEFNFLQYARI